MNSQPESELITHWLSELTNNDEAAQQKVWTLYAEHLARRARQQLNASKRRVEDEEDVATKVLNSLFTRMADGRMIPPENRHQLWALLMKMADMKSAEQLRNELADKRGGGNVRGESVFDSDLTEKGLDNAAPLSSHQIENAFDEAIALTNMMESLDDPELQRVAWLRIANHTIEEISENTGFSASTIRRRLDEIRARLVE